MIGEILGSYRIVRELGQGSMGAVYVAEHTILQRLAAVKVLLPMFSTDEVMVQRFFNEARALTAIQHPGIVQVFDFGSKADGSAYLIMEFLEGEPLADRLLRLGRLSLPEALRIARHCARALAAAHATGVIHRDLKPDNVLLVSDGEVDGGERAKLLDFGIAKLSDEKRFGLSQTHTGSVLGTPLYMAPEQCRSASDVDHRTDIYALGCVLFHMLCGRPPFVGDGIGDTIAGHMFEPPPPMQDLHPELPPMVEAVVQRALAKDPEDRYATMTELATALANAGPSAPASMHGVPAEVSELGSGESSAPTRESVSSLRYTNPSMERGQGSPAYASTARLEGSSTLGGAAAQSMATHRPRRRRLVAMLATLGLATVLGLVARGALTDSEPAPHAVSPGMADDAAAAADAAANEQPLETGVLSAITVRIESDPPGAAVYLPNGYAPLGTTPYAYEAPATPGEVLVRLTLEGYEAAEVSFPGDQNGVARVSMRQPSAQTNAPETGPGDDGAARRQDRRKKRGAEEPTPPEDELMYR